MRKLTEQFEEFTERLAGREIGRRVRLLAWFSLLLVVSCLSVLFLLRDMAIDIKDPVTGAPTELPLKSLLFREK